MHCVLSRPSAAVTLVVAMTTVCALGLPDGIGGRDSVVRLTRGGLHWMGCADTACHDHDDPEALVHSTGEAQPDAARVDGPPLVAVPIAPPAVAAPVAQTAGRSWVASRPRALALPGHAVSDRAPPALARPC